VRKSKNVISSDLALVTAQHDVAELPRVPPQVAREALEGICAVRTHIPYSRVAAWRGCQAGRALSRQLYVAPMRDAETAGSGSHECIDHGGTQQRQGIVAVPFWAFKGFGIWRSPTR